MKTNRVGMLSSLVGLMVGCGPALVHGTLELDTPLNVGSVGAVLQLQARMIAPSGERIEVSNEVSWSVSDSALGAIGSDGQLSLLAPGTVSVIAQYGSQRVATKITVRATRLPTLQLVPNVDSLNVGVRQQFLLLAGFEDGHQQDVTQQASWTFQGGLIASDNKGSALTTLAGPALVRASFEGRQVETHLMIRPAVEVGFRIEMATALRVGDQARLALISTSADGLFRDVSSVATWTSSNPDLAQIAVVNGAPSLQALRAGFTVVSASLNGITTAVAVTLFGKALAKVEFDLSLLDLASGAQQTVDVFARYGDGERVRVSAGVTFVSATPSVFTVDGSGVVTALTPGNSELWVTFEGMTAALDVQVGVARLVGLTPSVRSMRLALGQTAELKITGKFSDGTTVDLTPSATAVTNGSTRVKGGKALLVIAELEGAESLLIQAGGLETVVFVDVSVEPLVELRLTKVPVDLNHLRMIATARWADGLERDVTELAHWTVDSNGLATISDTAGSRGELSFSTFGDATIVATLGELGVKFSMSP